MTRLEILQELQDINTDAANYIYSRNYKALDSMVKTIYQTGLNREEEFHNTLKLFRLADMPFYIAGFNYTCEQLKDEIWAGYEPVIQDLVIHNVSLDDFLSTYGYSNEYDALNAADNNRKLYNRTVIKRIKLIEDYTQKYRALQTLYDSSVAGQIHSTTHQTDKLQDRFTKAVTDLIKSREKFYYYINYDLVGHDTEDLNKTLKQMRDNKKRINYLKNVTDSIFTTLQNNSDVNFRDFFIIKDNNKVTFTNYLRGKGISDNAWFYYKKKNNKQFVKERHFYLQMAFFLGLPTSNEVEKFLNYNGYTIKSPFRHFPNTDIYDYDVCRYMDAGISYDLINSMLGYGYV